jgi:hypothetical protein
MAYSQQQQLSVRRAAMTRMMITAQHHLSTANAITVAMTEAANSAGKR